MADVARGIHDKLVRRHPHVFGDVVADETARRHAQLGADQEGGEGHDVDRRGHHARACRRCSTRNKLFRKAASVGLDPGALDEALDRIDAAVGRLRAADADLEADLAQVLAAAVVVARAGGVDAESALRGLGGRYRRRFEAMEQLAAARDLDLAALDPPRRRRPLARSRRHALTYAGAATCHRTCVARGVHHDAPELDTCSPGYQVPRSMAGMVPMRPALKSSTAWRISSRVFITNGP